MFKPAIAAILGLLMSGCATVNCTYGGKPCEAVLDTEETVVLKCDKRVRIQPVREYGDRR